ncbi:hypothetical protein A7U43_01465 [Mycobacterium adipatum]|jgi:hypothetical protein|uniref:DUF732 domain-containing protein n=1 Tax=Mycobacterium adipatum TaxID=1682113 RepID=A0A172UGX0_9MYCO|nr:DUF732 domain-containing protein [Mycobacterium adipatum]ANE78181.1 hypothetical protein A7U43_01465 [Mycobacterium adipatum]MBI5735580.1 DUF732 domain-containing protein [Mycolicibacterium neoaurum]
MKSRLIAGLVSALVALPIAAAPVASADRDTDFAAQLHGFGIYGQRDFNAWLAKITCKRLTTGVDADARESAVFLSQNLARTTTTEQVWQFLGAGIPLYCPEHTAALTALAGDHA